MVYYHCHCLSAYLFVSDFLFALFRIVWWPSTGKELSSWLSICAVLCVIPSLMFVLLSRLMTLKSFAGCEIRLYRFLAILHFHLLLQI